MGQMVVVAFFDGGGQKSGVVKNYRSNHYPTGGVFDVACFFTIVGTAAVPNVSNFQNVLLTLFLKKKFPHLVLPHFRLDNLNDDSEEDGKPCLGKKVVGDQTHKALGTSGLS